MSARRNSEPACRVCGCTDHNACDEGCSWVKVAKDEAKPLCSACDGTAADLFEVAGRCLRMLRQPEASIPPVERVLRAAIRRYRTRVAREARSVDASWGGR